jgi:hypothetical protein
LDIEFIDRLTIAYLKFHHLGQFFMEPSNNYGAPINESPPLYSRYGIDKGLIKRGSTIDH